MKKQVILGIIVLILVALYLLPVTGCSDPGNNRLEKLMALIPATADQPNMLVTFNDYAARLEALDISYSSYEELLAKPPGMFMEASFICGGGQEMNRTTIREEYVGYDILDVDAEIWYGITPSEAVAAIGNFDPQKTSTALSNQKDWPGFAVEAYIAEEYNGVIIHSWGDGTRASLRDRRSPPVYDALGRAKPLAVTNDYLFSQASLEVVKEMIDASKNLVDTLMDIKKYAAITRELARHGVNQAIIGDSSLTNQTDCVIFERGKRITYDRKEALKPWLKRHVAFGSAPAKDSKGTYVLIVLYHENAQMAQENVTLLKERIETKKSSLRGAPWKEIFTSVDVKANRNLLIAKLHMANNGYFDDWLYMQSGLLAHEE